MGRSLDSLDLHVQSQIVIAIKGGSFSLFWVLCIDLKTRESERVNRFNEAMPLLIAIDSDVVFLLPPLQSIITCHMISDRCSAVPLDIEFQSIAMTSNYIRLPLLLLHTTNIHSKEVIAPLHPFCIICQYYYKSISKDVLSSWGGWSVAVALTSEYQL